MCSAARAILSVESAPQTPRAPFARAARQHRGQSSQASKASGVNSVCIVDPHFNGLFGLFLGTVAPRFYYSYVRRERFAQASPVPEAGCKTARLPGCGRAGYGLL